VLTPEGAIADLLGSPAAGVHVTWVEGSGCYGHNGADDAAADAALLSQLSSGPCVQWSRADEHGWEPRPAMIIDVAGGVDAGGCRRRLGFRRVDADAPSRPRAEPGGSASFISSARRCVADHPLARRRRGATRGTRTSFRDARHHASASGDTRTSSLRGLGSPQNSFANESFMTNWRSRRAQTQWSSVFAI
jgi:hypothetical protein